MFRSLSMSFAQKYLEPGESLAEVLFGLIMTLTFTLGAGLLVQDGADAMREMLIATVGCNVAWGIIDGTLYIGGQIFERGRLARLGQQIRSAPDEQAAVVYLAREFDDLLGVATEAAERDALYRRMVDHVRASPPKPVTVTRDDFFGAIASFWLVFFASLPAALPFLVFDDASVALRVSNLVLIGLLFVTGYRWAGYTALNPWRTGLALMVTGIVLVCLAIALGG